MSPCESRGVSRGFDGEEPTARRGSHHLLRLRRPLQEQLDGRRQHLQLDLRRFLLKSLQEALEELVSVVDALRVLSDDPDHRGLRLGLVQGVKVLAQRSDDRLVAIRELPEDVLDDDHSLLHHVVDLGLNQLKQHVDAAFGSSLEFDGAAPNGANRPPDEFDVDLCVMAGRSACRGKEGGVGGGWVWVGAEGGVGREEEARGGGGVGGGGGR